MENFKSNLVFRDVSRQSICGDRQRLKQFCFIAKATRKQCYRRKPCDAAVIICWFPLVYVTDVNKIFSTTKTIFSRPENDFLKIKTFHAPSVVNVKQAL